MWSRLPTKTKDVDAARRMSLPDSARKLETVAEEVNTHRCSMDATLIRLREETTKKNLQIEINRQLEKDLEQMRQVNRRLSIDAVNLKSKGTHTIVDDFTDVDVDSCGKQILALLRDLRSGQDVGCDRIDQLHDIVTRCKDIWLPMTPTISTSLDADVQSNLSMMLGAEVKSGRPSIEDFASNPEIDAILQTVDLWCWDAFKLRDYSWGRELPILTIKLFERTGVMQRLGIDQSKLLRFVDKVSASYRNNPYHNHTHAADVLQSMHKILIGGHIYPTLIDDVDLVACYVAAIIHDVDHSGFTNEFLVETTHSYAMMHNDRSPHENHHLFLAWTLLNEDEYNFLQSVDAAVKFRVRQTVIDLVLATDMKTHLSLMNQFGFLFVKQDAKIDLFKSSGFDLHGLNDEQRALLLKLVMKLADLGHMYADSEVHKRWVHALEEEYFKQGDVERSLGLKISPLMDRRIGGITRSQTGFFEVIALPLVRSFVRVVPACFPIRTAMERNYKYWQTYQSPSRTVVSQNAS